MHKTNIVKPLFLFLAGMFLVCSAAYGAEQVVYPQPSEVAASLGSEVSFDVYYNTSDGNDSLTGLGLRMHWDSGQLELQSIDEVYTQNLFSQGTPESGLQENGAGGSTDLQLHFSWLDIDAQWPPSALPIKLFRATFVILSEEASQVNFSASANPSGYTTSQTPMAIEPATATSLISIFTSPEGGGTVDGGGAYAPGNPVTVTATPATGYYFENWNENNQVVSEDAVYTFTVAGSRSLTANFARMIRVVLTGEDLEMDIAFNAFVVGTAAKETINVAPGASLAFFAGDEDRVNLPRNLSDYTITSAGNQLFLEDYGGSRIALSVIGTSTVGFADGEAVLGMAFPTGSMPYVHLGGAAVGSDPLNHGQVSLTSLMPGSTAVATGFAAGSGTVDDPYLVVNPAQLAGVRAHLSGYFKLGEDIDLDGFEGFLPIGTATDPFTGGFDGDGYIISNLFLDGNRMDYVGLFGSIADAQIRNIGLENVDIQGENLVGGLVGHAIHSTISDAFVTGFVGGRNDVGGLAGYIEAGPYPSAVNAYANCDVTGESAVGGLVGSLGATSSIANAYAVGNVSGRLDAGGLVGRNIDGGGQNVVDSFWDADVGLSSSSGAVGKTTAEMMAQDTFDGWDFDETWSIEEGASYPGLKR